MSLIGCESFGSTSKAGGGSLIASPFDTGDLGTVGITTTPAYTNAQYGGITSNQEGAWNTSSNPSTIIQGVRVMTDRADLYSEQRIFRIYDGTTIQCTFTLHMQTTQVVKVYRGDLGGTLLGTSSFIPGMNVNNVWWYVEWKVVLHGSAGTIEVRLNGGSTPILNLTGVNNISTANAFATKATLRSTNNYDDYYLCDGGGSAPFNTFLGDIRIYEVVPVSDDSVQFTPNSGANNFSRLTSMDDDTTYVESSTVGHVDTYNMTDLPTGVTPLAIEHRTYGRKTDAGVRELRAGFISGGNTHNGSSIVFPSGSNYSILRQVHEKDPTDNAAWTKSKVDALKSRLEVLS